MFQHYFSDAILLKWLGKGPGGVGRWRKRVSTEDCKSKGLKTLH